MKRLSAAMLLLLLSVMFTIGGSMAYDNAVYGDNTESSRGVFEKNNVMSVATHNIEYGRSASYTPVETGAVFNSQKWEPGYSEAAVFNVTTSVDATFNIRISSSAELNELANVIDVYYSCGDVTKMSSRVEFESTLNFISSFSDLINDDPVSICTVSGNSVTQPISLVLKMRESAGNHYMNMPLCKDDGTFTVTVTVSEIKSQ